VARKALLVVVHQTRPLAVPLVKAVESVRPLVVSLAALLEQPVSQPGKRQLAMRQEQSQVASQQRAQQQVQLVLEQPESPRAQEVLRRSERPSVARPVQPRALRVFLPRWGPQLRELQEQPAASAQPWLQLPWLWRRPWHPLPP
jgi:hypothetical protein